MFRKNGSTSVKTRVVLVGSSTGVAKTGLDTSSAGLIISLIADTEASGTAYSGSNLETIATIGTYAAPTGGKVRFKEVDSTNHKGLYEIQAADARWGVSDSQAVQVCVTATGILTAHKEVQLVSFDPNDVVRLGLTALPNAAAGANGGIPTGNASGQVVVSGTAAGAIAAASFAAGAIDNAAIATDAIGAAELAASAITEIQSGISTLDAAGVRAAIGMASANLDTQLSTISGYLDTEIAAIKTKTDFLPSATAGAAGGLFIAGTNAATVVTGSLTTTFTGNVTGSVASVATGGITAASFTAGAIDNAAIAADAIGASELAASAVTEIQSGLSTLDAAGVRTAVGLASANLDTQLAAINAKTTNLPADPADASDIQFATNAIFQAVGVVNDAVIAVKAKTDNLPADPAASGDVPTPDENADALLDRNMATGTDSGGRTVRNALRTLRNKVSLTAHAGEATVYKEDDTTEAWRAVLTTNSAAEPITSVDPA